MLIIYAYWLFRLRPAPRVSTLVPFIDLETPGGATQKLREALPIHPPFVCIVLLSIKFFCHSYLKTEECDLAVVRLLMLCSRVAVSLA